MGKIIGRLSVALIMTMLAVAAMAQDDDVYMNVILKDGTTHQFPASEILEVRIVKEPMSSPRRIGFMVETPAISTDDGNGGAGNAPRKTKETVMETFPGFYLFAFTDDDNWDLIANGLLYTVSDDDGVWSVSGDGTATWPYDDDQNVRFYAVGAKVNKLETLLTEVSQTRMFNPKDPFAHIVVTEDAEKHDDIIVAQTVKSYNTAKVPDEPGGDTYREGKSVVHLYFRHVTAGLQFSLKSSLGQRYAVDVQNVVLKNVINNGDYHFNSDSWTVPQPGTTECSDYTLTSATDHNAVVLPLDGTPIRFGDVNSNDDYLFMIPQQRATWDVSESKDAADAACKFYVEVNCRIKDTYSDQYVLGSNSSYGQLYFRLSPNWERNQIYPYAININSNARTVDENGSFKKVFE